MIGLHALLTEHGEAVEADLQRFYNVRLSDVFAGTLSLRRLDVLVRNMPDGSATARAIHGEVVEWGATEHLLALVADLLAQANWQRQGDKGKPAPKPVDRPGYRNGRIHRVMDPDEVRRRLLAQKGET